MSVDRNDTSATLVITNTRVDGRATDVHIAGNRIARVVAHDPDTRIPPGARRIDGTGTAALPGLMNAHTHTAMALFRSFADDMPLMQWLQEKIWPLEQRLTEEDVYWGARFGCLEMIRTGTTFFNDMYWFFHGTARAAADAGLRAVLAGVIIDIGGEDQSAAQREQAIGLMDDVARYGDRIRFALGPHAVYTVGPESLRWAAEQSAERGLFVHIHLSETMVEVENCVREHGVRPPEYLDRLGLLSERCFAAHCVHLEPYEVELLAERGVHPIHNPVSNLKLASGGPMPYAAMREAGLEVLIGTDGAASNNNLDLLEELKFAALMAKHATGDPTVLPAPEALALATTHAARAFGIDAGEIAPGKLADIILVDLSNPFLFPGHDLDADLVYAAHGRAVRTTICDGQALMEDGVIPDEAEIRREVRARFGRIAGG